MNPTVETSRRGAKLEVAFHSWPADSKEHRALSLSLSQSPSQSCLSDRFGSVLPSAWQFYKRHWGIASFLLPLRVLRHGFLILKWLMVELVFFWSFWWSIDYFVMGIWSYLFIFFGRSFELAKLLACWF